MTDEKWNYLITMTGDWKYYFQRCFYLPNNPENQNFEKKKQKNLGDIIILYMCIIILYMSYKRRDVSIFSAFAILILNFNLISNYL